MQNDISIIAQSFGGMEQDGLICVEALSHEKC